MQLRHTQPLQAVATPLLWQHCNLLVKYNTIFHVNYLLLFAQDTLKDYKEVDLHGARQGVVARRRARQQATIKSKVHQCAYIHEGQLLLCQRRVL